MNCLMAVAKALQQFRQPHKTGAGVKLLFELQAVYYAPIMQHCEVAADLDVL